MNNVKVCLVFPPHMRIDAYYVTPPLGLLSIAASLEKQGIDVAVVDLIYAMRSGKLSENSSIYDNSVNMILDTKPTIVGFSTQCVTYPTCINIAKRIKAVKPDIKIIFGGHNSSFLDQETLEQFPFIDYICRGEGEIVVPRLIDAIKYNKDLKQIKGVTYYQGSTVIRNEDEELISNLDELPFPAYHLVDSLSNYKVLGEKMTILFESGRGCIYNCIFCSNCRLWQRKVRYKSIPKLIEEIKQLELFHPDEYYLVHDFFTYDEKYVLDFCNALFENSINIKWNCRCRLNVSRNTLMVMKKAGCERLLYGVESGSKKVLKIMKKNIRFEDVYDSIRNTIECGIVPSLSFVVGIPGETLDDLNQTLHLILLSQVMGNCYPFMQIICPLPGTSIHENYSKELYIHAQNAFSRGIEYNNGERLEEDLDLIKKYPALFSSFYNVKSDIPMEYLNEISKIYCIIIEMFALIYYAYCSINQTTEIELYNMWKDWIQRERNVKSIDELSKRDIWKYFDEYIHSMDIQSDLLKNLYKYVHVRYKLLISDEPEKKITEYFDININQLITCLQKHQLEEFVSKNIDTKLLFVKEDYIIRCYILKSRGELQCSQ